MTILGITIAGTGTRTRCRRQLPLELHYLEAYRIILAENQRERKGIITGAVAGSKDRRPPLALIAPTWRFCLNSARSIHPVPCHLFPLFPSFLPASVSNVVSRHLVFKIGFATISWIDIIDCISSAYSVFEYVRTLSIILKRSRSTLPNYRFASVFAQLGSWLN